MVGQYLDDGGDEAEEGEVLLDLGVVLDDAVDHGQHAVRAGIHAQSVMSVSQ